MELIEISDDERAALKEVAAELLYRVSLTDRDDLRLAWLAGLLTGIAARPPLQDLCKESTKTVEEFPRAGQS